MRLLLCTLIITSFTGCYVSSEIEALKAELQDAEEKNQRLDSTLNQKVASSNPDSGPVFDFDQCRLAEERWMEVQADFSRRKLHIKSLNGIEQVTEAGQLNLDQLMFKETCEALNRSLDELSWSHLPTNWTRIKAEQVGHRTRIRAIEEFLARNEMDSHQLQWCERAVQRHRDRLSSLEATLE